MDNYKKYRKYKKLYINYNVRKGGSDQTPEQSTLGLDDHKNNNYFFRNSVFRLSPKYIEPGMWETKFMDINSNEINRITEWFNINEIDIDERQKIEAIEEEEDGYNLRGWAGGVSNKYLFQVNRAYISTNIVKCNDNSEPDVEQESGQKISIDYSYHSYGNINQKFTNWTDAPADILTVENILNSIYKLDGNAYESTFPSSLLTKIRFEHDRMPPWREPLTNLSIIDRIFYNNGRHMYRLIGLSERYPATETTEDLDKIDFTKQEIQGLWYDITNQESSDILPDVPSGTFISRVRDHFI